MRYSENSAEMKKFFRYYLFLFLNKGGGRKRGREAWICERNINRLPLIHAPTRDPNHNPGMCPNQELNR